MPGEMPQTPYEPPEPPDDPLKFEPLTAREALLEIRRRMEGESGITRWGMRSVIDRLAAAGLERSEPINFELTDQLADRLAEAHRLLGDLREGTVMASLREEISEALALPPDLEAMVERRIGSR